MQLSIAPLASHNGLPRGDVIQLEGNVLHVGRWLVADLAAPGPVHVHPNVVADPAEQDAGPGTDFHAIRSRKISITPIHTDLTSYTAMDKVASWLGGDK